MNDLQLWLPLYNDVEDKSINHHKMAIRGYSSGSSTPYTFKDEGKLGYALEHDPSKAYGHCYTASGDKVDATIYQTGCAWIYLNDDVANSAKGIFTSYRSSATYKPGVAFVVGADNKVGVLWGEACSCYGQTPLLKQKWYHVAYTYSADTYTFNVYVNGELDGSYKCSASSTRPNFYGTGDSIYLNTVVVPGTSQGQVSMTLGSPSNYFSGKMSDIRIYSKRLSQYEIKRLAKGLVACYPLRHELTNRSAKAYIANSGDSYRKFKLTKNDTVTRGSMGNYSTTSLGNGIEYYNTPYRRHSAYISDYRKGTGEDHLHNTYFVYDTPLNNLDESECTLSMWMYDYNYWSNTQDGQGHYYSTTLFQVYSGDTFYIGASLCGGEFDTRLYCVVNHNGERYSNISKFKAHYDSFGWVFFAMTFKDGLYKFYANGELIWEIQVEVSYYDFYPHQGIPCSFGCGAVETPPDTPWGGYAFERAIYNGMSDIRIYSTAFTEQEIQDLYLTTFAIDKNGFKCYDIDEGFKPDDTFGVGPFYPTIGVLSGENKDQLYEINEDRNQEDPIIIDPINHKINILNIEEL